MDKRQFVAGVLSVIGSANSTIADTVNQKVELQNEQLRAQSAYTQTVPMPPHLGPVEEGTIQVTVDADGNLVSTEREITTQDDPGINRKLAPEAGSADELMDARLKLDRLRDHLGAEGFGDEALDESLQGVMDELDKTEGIDDIDRLKHVKEFLDSDLADAARAQAEQRAKPETDGVEGDIDVFDVEELDVEEFEVEELDVQELEVADVPELEVEDVTESDVVDAGELDEAVLDGPLDELPPPPEDLAAAPAQGDASAGTPPPVGSGAPAPESAPSAGPPPEPEPH